jgi:hypothetical protein
MPTRIVNRDLKAKLKRWPQFVISAYIQLCHVEEGFRRVQTRPASPG